MASAISFSDVSKIFRGPKTYRSLRDELVAGTARLAGRHPAPARVVRALEDVTFEIPEGQAIALIGANGAGKTTALKLATRITYPTSGRLRVRGRVSALIEVGTGMHQELTGRENIDLYGRILGFTRRDVRRRFDQIVEFAGMGYAIDQPVKQFSSGMQLRLGFALASHLEPDVLLVDEAIAVGDALFQYRCIERMAELGREGRTLVFVSHDMTTVERLCARAVLLHKGRLVSDGPAREVVGSYLAEIEAELLEATPLTGGAAGTDLEIHRVTLHDADGREIEQVDAGRPLTARLHFRTKRPISRPVFEVGIADPRRGTLAVASMLFDRSIPDELDGDGHVDCTFAEIPLAPRVYELWCGVRQEPGFAVLADWRRVRLFRVGGGGDESSGGAPVTLAHRWSVESGVVSPRAAGPRDMGA